MTRLAILDELLPAQLRERPQELSPVEVVWTGTDLDQLVRDAGDTEPTVLALDFDLLGGEEHAAAQTRRLMDATGAELAIVMHGFTRREVLREVTRPGVRTVRSPISLGALKAQMTSVIVRQMLGGEEAPRRAWPARSEAPVTATVGITAGVTPRRFTRAQLGRLREIQSRVECECPNHLSDLVLALSAFEDYSAGCENKSPADALIHAGLYRSTAEARRIMEDALEGLLEHEGITL